jgi:2-polyprenyl-3-methyl-5-hydroxy-6-metoxy-1,4-benzoquinol methylase
MSDKIEQCILCQSKELELLKNFNAGDLVRCKSCFMVFSSLIPSQSTLATHYGAYRMFDQISDITIKRYNQLLDQFEKYRQTNRIIDVGCGQGFFLEQAKKRGWEVYGTEFAPQYIKVCSDKGIRMNEGVLTLVNYPPESFDIVTSFEVIEHLSYPLQELKNFNSLLRPGGLLYITTPNFNSLSRRIQGDHWTVISYPDHLSYFTPGTINKALSTAGFRKKKILTTGISIARTQQALFKNENPPNEAKEKIEKPVDSVWQERIEGNFLLKVLKGMINRFLTLSHSGDGIKAMYTKK